MKSENDIQRAIVDVEQAIADNISTSAKNILWTKLDTLKWVLSAPDASDVCVCGHEKRLHEKDGCHAVDSNRTDNACSCLVFTPQEKPVWTGTAGNELTDLLKAKGLEDKRDGVYITMPKGAVEEVNQVRKVMLDTAKKIEQEKPVCKSNDKQELDADINDRGQMSDRSQSINALKLNWCSRKLPIQNDKTCSTCAEVKGNINNVCKLFQEGKCVKYSEWKKMESQ